jgi:cation:H+ antiporter
VIALTIVSIGTSLPELATSVIAALKKNPEIAIGNIVGSNIFNIFFILGLSAVINPVTVVQEATTDLIVNIIAGAFLFVFVLTGNGRKLSRIEGGLFVLFYLAYITLLIIG